VFCEAQLGGKGEAKVGEGGDFLDFFSVKMEDMVLFTSHVKDHDFGLIHVDVEVVRSAILL